MRISFYIADKAVGATGFRAVWTEVKRREVCRDGEFKFKSTWWVTDDVKDSIFS